MKWRKIREQPRSHLRRSPALKTNIIEDCAANLSPLQTAEKVEFCELAFALSRAYTMMRRIQSPLNH
jgi:hypothetical protein